jgi:hypothetical protein
MSNVIASNAGMAQTYVATLPGLSWTTLNGQLGTQSGLGFTMWTTKMAWQDIPRAQLTGSKRYSRRQLICHEQDSY